MTHNAILPSSLRRSTSYSRLSRFFILFVLFFSVAFSWPGSIALDAEGLSSRRVEDRRKAIVALARHDISRVQDYFLGALGDNDLLVRKSAAEVLAKHKIPEIVPVLEGWQSDPRSEVRVIAAELLGYFPSKNSVAALIRTLGDPEKKVRHKAVLSLGKIGGPDVVVALIERLRDDETAIRQATVEELEKLRDPRALIPIVSMFNDPAQSVRKRAIQAAGRFQNQSIVPALLRLLRDPSAKDVHEMAVISLGMIGAHSAAAFLINRLETSAGALDGAILSTLGRIAMTDSQSSGRALRVVIASLASRSRRHIAMEVLHHVGAKARPALIQVIDNTVAGDLKSAVLLLTLLPDKRATPLLIAELDRDRVERPLIFQALAKTRDPRAFVPILSYLSDPDLKVDALRALRPLLHRQSPAEDILIELLEDSDPEVQLLAVEYVALLRSKKAIPALIEVLARSKTTAIRKAAIVALGEIADPQGADALLSVIQQEGGALAEAAATSLIYINSYNHVEALMNTPPTSASLRALGGILHGKTNANARLFLRRIANSQEGTLGAYAIEALGRMKGSSPLILALAKARSDQAKQATALRVLSFGHDPSIVPLLRAQISSRVDSTAGVAAFSLATHHANTKPILSSLVSAARSHLWSLSINGSYGLASKATLQEKDVLLVLLHHRSPYVRANAALACGRLKIVAALPRIIELARADDKGQPTLLTALAALLSSLPGRKDEVLRSMEPAKRKALEKHLTKTVRVTRRTASWKELFFVDEDNNLKPVVEHPYTIRSADGRYAAFYTSKRGRIFFREFTPGPYTVTPN